MVCTIKPKFAHTVCTIKAFLFLNLHVKLPFLSGLAMNKAVTTVCDNLNSGSDDEVFLKFRSTKGENNETFTCRTEFLDTVDIDDWIRGSTQRWGYEVNQGKPNHNFLGECAKDFRPYDKLEFKVIIHRPNVNIDDVEICHLTVTFGENYPEQKGSSRWVWPTVFGDTPRGAWTYYGTDDDDWQIGNGPKQEDTKKGETNWLVLQKK